MEILLSYVNVNVVLWFCELNWCILYNILFKFITVAIDLSCYKFIAKYMIKTNKHLEFILDNKNTGTVAIDNHIC